jgi:hypothetical protein
LKVTHVKLGKAASRQSKRLLTICAELAGPHEFMTITVTVANGGREQDVCQSGIARAQDFARHFGALPLQCFPTKQVRDVINSEAPPDRRSGRI